MSERTWETLAGVVEDMVILRDGGRLDADTRAQLHGACILPLCEVLDVAAGLGGGA